MDLSKTGDADRRRQIEQLPETVEIARTDGSATSILFRDAALAADEDWVRFRDSDFCKAIFEGGLEQ